MSDESLQSELAQIRQTIANIRTILANDPDTLATTLATFLQKEAALQAQLGQRSVATQSSLQVAGDRSAVGSSAGENIISGDNNTVNRILNVYLTEGGRPPDEVTLRRQMVSYLTWMRDQYGKIELRGIKREGQQVVQLNLETVYVPLEAETYGRSRDRRIELDQVLGLGRRVIVTGGPGSGKTTVLLHLAWTLTEAILTDDPALVETKLGLKGELPLPIFVPLSAYALHRRHLPVHASPEEKTLAAFISRYQIEKQTSFELPTDFFQQLLRSGKEVMLLLDGLDEVPDEAERVLVRQAIEDLVTGRETMRVAVTCRSAAYKDRTALGKGFRDVRVQPLDAEHLAALIRQAYLDLYRHDPHLQQTKADELLDGIANLEAERRRRFGREVEPLVASPLLVRMLLVVHYSERRLPDQRAELYMKATDAMLLPEYALDEAVADRIGGLVGGSREIHRELVQHLAFEMHRRGETQGREITEGELRDILDRHPIYAPFTQDFIALTRLRGTLLEERLGIYRFIHLAFQEYLAARYLAEIVRGEAGIHGIAEFLEAGPIQDSWWRESALLTAGYLTITSPQTAQNLLRRWAGLDDQADRRTAERSPEIQLAMAEIAAAAAAEWPNRSEVLAADLAGRLVRAFQQADFISRTPPVLRAAAGDTLARLGDPRESIMTIDGMEFCLIPAGPFMMGSPDEDELAFEDEKPLHPVDLKYDYWLGRYPVTVAQFQAFVAASGYTGFDDDSLGDPANRPVRYVTWYDALAFCRWLTDYLRAHGLLPPDWAITLPGEAEWEKAARGGLKVPTGPLIARLDRGLEKRPFELAENPDPSRRYPWGGRDPEPDRMNFDQTGIDTTSAVGCFPNGASPYGCEEMSGNVWEWTRSLWGKGDEPDFGYPYSPADGRENLEASRDIRRVLRGGSFNNLNQGVRCAVRNDIGPVDGHWSLGFRCVAAPANSGL